MLHHKSQENKFEEILSWVTINLQVKWRDTVHNAILQRHKVPFSETQFDMVLRELSTIEYRCVDDALQDKYVRHIQFTVNVS